MTKGTTSFGKKNKRPTHIRCRRCGKHSYNWTEKYCASCGYGKRKKMNKYTYKIKR
ncbi:MAG: 50S ribosomal protein L37e [Thermoproteota archaeon]|nr:50S ribosomal protein L37e [Thermoproteota archaeon]